MEKHEFTVRYDEADMKAAARLLFIKAWHPIFPLLLPLSLVILLFAAVIYNRYAGYRPIVVAVVVLVAINLVYWPYVYYAYRRQFARRWRGIANISVTTTDISIASDSGVSTLPWSMIRGSHQDSKNLLLFVSRFQAVVIPIANLSSIILEFISRQVSPQRGRG